MASGEELKNIRSREDKGKELENIREREDVGAKLREMINDCYTNKRAANATTILANAITEGGDQIGRASCRERVSVRV